MSQASKKIDEFSFLRASQFESFAHSEHFGSYRWTIIASPTFRPVQSTSSQAMRKRSPQAADVFKIAAAKGSDENRKDPCSHARIVALVMVPGATADLRS